MAIDLICGMEVNETAAKPSVRYDGESYYFCSEGCRAEFKRRPQDYLKREACFDEASREEKGGV